MSAALPNATAWITVVETSQGPSRQVNWTKMRGVDHSPLFSEAQTQAYATEARADLDAAIERKDALLRQALEYLAELRDMGPIDEGWQSAELVALQVQIKQELQ